LAGRPAFVDIHCHLLPGIDDGAADLQTSLAMARMAVADGISTIVATPHQLGTYRQNEGELVRRLTRRLQEQLHAEQIPLTVLPGGDVRVEDDLLRCLSRGEALTLAGAGRHVLLELPHELYFPLEPLLDNLKGRGLVGILSHPERNHGILRDRSVLPNLVKKGCQMQVTAGSLHGSFGPPAQELAQWMLREDLVHYIATDAHGVRSRRPIISRAFAQVETLCGRQRAIELCCDNPQAVVADAVPARQTIAAATSPPAVQGKLLKRASRIA